MSTRSMNTTQDQDHRCGGTNGPAAIADSSRVARSTRERPADSRASPGIFEQFKKAVIRTCTERGDEPPPGYASGQPKPEGMDNHRNGKAPRPC